MAGKTLHPRRFAARLGIRIALRCDPPFRIAVTRDRVFCAWHSDRRVRRARMWEGLAACLLERAGLAWSEDAALALGARLSIGAPPIS
jgi:hypothetical protein